MFRSGFFLFALLVLPCLVLSQQECVFSSGSSRKFSELRFDGDCSVADVAVFKKSSYIQVDTAYSVPAAIRVEEKGKVTLDGAYGSSFSNTDGLEVHTNGEVTMKNFVNLTTWGFFVHQNEGKTNVNEQSYLWFTGSRARLNNSGEFENKGLVALRGNGYTHFLNNKEASFTNEDTFLVHGGTAVVFRNDGKIMNNGAIFLDSETRGSFLNEGHIENHRHLSIGHNFITVRAGNISLGSTESVLHIFAPKFLSFDHLTGRGAVFVGTYANDTRTAFKVKANVFAPDAGRHIEFHFPNNDVIHLEGTLHIRLLDVEGEFPRLKFHRGVDISKLSLRVEKAKKSNAYDNDRDYPILEAEFIQGTFASFSSADGEDFPENIGVKYGAQSVQLYELA